MNLGPAATGLSRVAFDLDGTIATNTWPSPDIGEPIERGINLMLTCEELGYEVVIYTARPLSHQQRIIEWLEENGLDDLVYDVICGKVQAELYVDDRSYNPFSQNGDIHRDGEYRPNSEYDVGDGSAASSLATSSDGGRSKAAASPTFDDGIYDGDMCPNCVTPWKCNGPHEKHNEPHELDDFHWTALGENFL